MKMTKLAEGVELRTLTRGYAEQFAAKVEEFGIVAHFENTSEGCRLYLPHEIMGIWIANNGDNPLR